MKGFRGTLVFAIVVIAIAGATFWQYKHSEKESEQKATASSLFHELKADDVVEFSLANAKKNYSLRSGVASAPGQWSITAPFADKASSEPVKSQISSIFSQSVVSPETDGINIDWAKYGLFEPEYTLTFKFSSGKQSILKVGRVRTYDQGYYLRLNDDPKLLVGDRAWDTILGKDVDSFRSMRPQIPESAIEVVYLHSSQKGKEANFEVTHEKDDWALSGQPNTKISTQRMNEWINAIRELAGESVVSPTKEKGDLEKFGLIRPEVTIRLGYPLVKGEEKAKDKLQHFIYISSARGKDKAAEAFWYSSDNPAIYKIQPAKVSPLLKTTDELRDLGFVFKFAVDQAAHLHYRRGSELPVDLDKVGTDWKLHTADEKLKVNQLEVNAFFNYLQGLQAAKFLKGKSAKGLEENEIIVQDDKGQTIYHLQFGGEIKDTLNNKAKIEYYTAKSSASDDLFAVTKASLDEFAKKKMVEPIIATPVVDDKKDLGRVTENKTVEGKAAAKAKR